MGFADNLQYLRKKAGMTQEQLAEQLDISRQSVSKWESEASYPEMDKLLQLCEIFHFNLTVLVQGNAEESLREDSWGYEVFHNWYSKWTTIGVAIVLAGIAVMMLLNGVGVLDEVSTMVFFVFLIVGTLILVVAGLQHEAYVKKHPIVEDFYTPEEKAAFQKKFIVWMAVGVGLILVAVLLFLGSELIDFQVADQGDFSVGLFMIMLDIAVPILVYMGMQKEKYDISSYNKNKGTNQSEEMIGKACACIFIAATAIYLGVSFIFQVWHIAWVVFPIAGLLCGIVAIILHKEERGS